MSGYARFHRSLIGHPAFRNDAEAMAFAYMVLRASWKPTRVRYKGHAVTLNRGQLSMSQRDMAAALDRDKAWVERLWKRLRAEAMIAVTYEAGAAVITICNYEKYQAANDTREAVDEAPQEADARQTQGTEQGIEEGKKEVTEASPQRAIVPAQPVRDALTDWNEAAASAGWPQVAKFTASRQQSLRNLLRTDGLDGWRSALGRARASPFLGRSPPSWFTFDFIVKPGNFAKVIEGNYDQPRSNGQHHPGHRRADEIDDAARQLGFT